jgi:hypothetical protein
MHHTFGGSGFVSLASLIALMLLVAESGSGAFDSHSSRLNVGFGRGVGVFRRGVTREEDMIVGRVMVWFPLWTTKERELKVVI